MGRAEAEDGYGVEVVLTAYGGASVVNVGFIALLLHVSIVARYPIHRLAWQCAIANGAYLINTALIITCVAVTCGAFGSGNHEVSGAGIEHSGEGLLRFPGPDRDIGVIEII